jgi:hypothetical protein
MYMEVSGRSDASASMSAIPRRSVRSFASRFSAPGNPFSDRCVQRERSAPPHRSFEPAPAMSRTTQRCQHAECAVLVLLATQLRAARHVPTMSSRG